MLNQNEEEMSKLRFKINVYIAPNSLILRAASFEVVEAELGEQVYSPL
jgi:hypothetical protein